MGIVQMGAKTVWHIKSRRFKAIFLPPLFLTKKYLNLSNFLDTFRLVSCAGYGSALMNERKKPTWPKRAKNEWVKRCETEIFLKNSSTNFTWSSSPGGSVPYDSLGLNMGGIWNPMGSLWSLFGPPWSCMDHLQANNGSFGPNRAPSALQMAP